MTLKGLLKNSLVENFISLGVIQGINYLLPLITIPFLFNQLGVENYGLVNFSFAFIQYFIILTDFGFGLSATRFIASNRDDKEKVNRFLNSACLARLFMAIVSFLVLSVCLFTVPRFASHKLFTVLFFGQVLGNVMNPTWFFQGMEKMKFNTVVHVITRLVSILPLFVIIREPEDYIYIPICYSGGSIVAGICSMAIIRTQFNMRFFFTTLKEVWTVTKDSANYFLSRLSVSLFTNTNAVVLGLVCGDAAVGYYSLAEKIYVALNSLYGPVNQTIFPYMTKNRNLSLFKKFLFYGFGINAFILVCFYFVFPYLAPFVFDNFAPESFNVLSILLFSNLISLPATFLGYPFLAAWGHPNYCNYSLIASSLFHLLGLAILYTAGILSIYSVACMVVLCEAFLLGFRIYGVKLYNLWHEPKHQTV